MSPVRNRFVLSSNLLFTVGLLLVCLLPLVPLALFPTVPGSDSMMHIARAAIETRSGSAFFRDVVTYDSVVLPNLAVDFLVPLLAKAMPVALAGRVFVALCFALQTSGALALMFAVQRRLTLAAFFIPLICYSSITGWGFLGFMLGTGLALWGFATSLLLENRSFGIRLLNAVAFSLLLYFCHLAAFGLYAASVIFYGILRLRLAPESRAMAKRSLVVLVSGCVPVVLIHFLKSSVSKSTGIVRNGPWHWVHEFLAFLNTYYSTSFWLLWMAALATVVLLLATRRLKVEKSLGWTALGLYLLYLVTPYEIYGSLYASTRLLPYVSLVFLASLGLREKALRFGAAIAGWAGVLVLVQFALVTKAWTRLDAYREPMLKGVRQASPGTMFLTLAQPPNDPHHSRLLSSLGFQIEGAIDDPSWHPDVDHLGDEVALEGDYFPIQNYLLPGKQPVNIREKFYGIYFPVNSANGTPTTEEEFQRADPATRAAIFANLKFTPLDVVRLGDKLPAFLKDVDARYRAIRRASGIDPDAGVYVIYFHRGHPANPAPGLLREVSHDDQMVNVYELKS